MQKLLQVSKQRSSSKFWTLTSFKGILSIDSVLEHLMPKKDSNLGMQIARPARNPYWPPPGSNLTWILTQWIKIQPVVSRNWNGLTWTSLVVLKVIPQENRSTACDMVALWGKAKLLRSIFLILVRPLPSSSILFLCTARAACRGLWWWSRG